MRLLPERRGRTPQRATSRLLKVQDLTDEGERRERQKPQGRCEVGAEFVKDQKNGQKVGELRELERAPEDGSS
jgi:hypothetical protein